jgi:hypothetical protein
MFQLSVGKVSKHLANAANPEIVLERIEHVPTTVRSLVSLKINVVPPKWVGTADVSRRIEDRTRGPVDTTASYGINLVQIISDCQNKWQGPQVLVLLSQNHCRAAQGDVAYRVNPAIV